MSLTTDVSRQYLKAMGVESWELRGNDAVDQAVGEGVQATEQPVMQSLRASLTDAASFLQKLAFASVTPSIDNGAGRKAELLVLLESPQLTAPGTELLRSMLKAIDVDLDLQVTATIGRPGADVDSVQAVARSVQPSIILVMAGLHADLDSLSVHRAALQAVDWTSAPIAITLHPEVLLEIPAYKRQAWEDLKRVKQVIDR